MTIIKPHENQGELPGMPADMERKAINHDLMRTAAFFLYKTSAGERQIRAALSEFNERHDLVDWDIWEKICDSFKDEARAQDAGIHFIAPGEDEGTSRASNLQHRLAVLGYKIRYNLRACRNEVMHAEMTSWKPVDGVMSALLIRVIEERVLDTINLSKDGNGKWKVKPQKQVRYTPTIFNQDIDSATAYEQIDPFMAWLELLPEWDGIDRLEHLLEDSFSVEGDSELARWAIKSIIIAAVNRTYNPGAKHDEVVVLIGKEGIGKSMFWRELLPSGSLFNDSLNLSGSDKEKVESLLGMVIVEAAELRGTSKAELESLKAFITRQMDATRLTYRRDVDQIPRRCVIVGTSNDEECLPNDATGNRRFLPIKVAGDSSTAAEIKRRLPELRGQIWAEALHRYRAGEAHHIPAELKPKQREALNLHRIKNESMEELVLETARHFIFTQSNPSITEFLDEMGYKEKPRKLQMAVARILELYGAEKNHTRSGKKWDFSRWNAE